jgi:hypothetical protein
MSMRFRVASVHKLCRLIVRIELYIFITHADASSLFNVVASLRAAAMRACALSHRSSLMEKSVRPTSFMVDPLWLKDASHHKS